MFTTRSFALVTKCPRFLRLPHLELSTMPDFKNHSVVRTVDKDIDNNTNLFIESPIHVKIIPVDVNNVQMHSKLLMQLYSLNKDSSEFNLKQSSKRLELINTQKATDHNDVCLIRVPLQLKVHVTTTAHACVDISKMQGEEFYVKTDKGAVNLTDIQAKDISVETSDGSVFCSGRLQAAKIALSTTGSGGITCNNIMSNDFQASTHNGPINVKSCYSDKSHFITARGDIILKNVHRQCIIDVIEKGDIHITSFEGQLLATLKSGDVFLHAANLTEKSSLFVHEKGKVDLILSDEIKKLTAINLLAAKINVEGAIHNGGRLMTDTHPERFRYPIDDDKKFLHELLVECRNGNINLKETNLPMFLSLT